MHPVRHLTCSVETLDMLTHDIRRIRLKVVGEPPLQFAAGQFAKVTFPDQPTRYYSIASLPDDHGIEFHIRRSRDESSTSHFVLDQLSTGDQVMVEAPMGESHLRDDHQGEMLCVAGGSGMAPIRCIVETALKTKADRGVHLYFGARDEQDIYLEERFSELVGRHDNFRFTPVLSEASGETARRTGFVHEVVGSDIESFDGWKAYIAGPPVMVDAVVGLLQEHGLAETDIHADKY
jgi:CDP-4-dehydro-6-deoxyglucose reductase/ferredoxin-NAD(P)+ reductase (naphthalene dioxygenase ferredoxin-specific)